MSDKSTGGPAFPVAQELDGIGMPRCESWSGMTLRDWFAGKALNAILSQDDYGVTANAPRHKLSDGTTHAQCWAETAYEIADAMIRARKS